MSPHFVTGMPDVEAIVRGVLSRVERTELVKPELAAPYRVLVSRADLQGRVTALTRYCRVGVQAWSVREDGTADVADAFDLAAAAGRALEAAPLTSAVIVAAEIQSGAARVRDEVTGVEYQYLTVLLQVIC